MPIILLEFHIQAPISRCFDLARSIDLHKVSTRQTHEEAIGGVTSGLIGLNESVTWRAKHFGVYHKLTSKITEFNPPHFFVDEMQKGAFNRFRHEHQFEEHNGITRMKDVFEYKSPFGVLGTLADWLILERYMRNLLLKRNLVIKEFAESERWKEVL